MFGMREKKVIPLQIHFFLNKIKICSHNNNNNCANDCVISEDKLLYKSKNASDICWKS